MSDAKERRKAAKARHAARMKAEGRRQIHLWVRDEDVAALQEAARSGHGLARLRAEALAKVETEVREAVTERLELRTERALLAQARAEARQHPAGSNAPPARIRLGRRPPGTFRRRCREAGWRYDPVAAVWHLPDDPGRWAVASALIEEAEAAGLPVEKLATPDAD